MADVVTIEQLSAAKRIPAATLRSFGLVDTPKGVLFEYRTSDGARARPRLRTAMRGVDGSEWGGPASLPITIYSPPPGIEATVTPQHLILVEGESDCWAAWLHGVAACGIPGPKYFDRLAREHVAGFSSLYLLREPAPDDSPTYAEGVEAYIHNIVERLGMIGFRGEVYELRMPDGLYDLSELHRDDPQRFLSRLAKAKAAASLICSLP